MPVVRALPNTGGYARYNMPVWLGLGERIRRPYGVNAHNGFTADQPAISTVPLLTGAVALNGSTLSVTTGLGIKFIAGQAIVVWDAAANVGETVVVQSVAGDDLTIKPTISRAAGYAIGCQVSPVWSNASHVEQTAFQAWLAQTIVDARLHNVAIGGYDALTGRGSMATRYTDTNGIANVPTGWVSFNHTELAASNPFVRTNWSSTASWLYTFDSNGIQIATAATDVGNTGMELVAPVEVQPGQQWVISWLGMAGGGKADVVVYDVTGSAEIARTPGADQIGASTAGNVNGAGTRTTLSFTVPAGCRQVQIRVVSAPHTAAAYTFDIDDILMVPAQHSLAQSQYVIPPCDVLVIGDSWFAASNQWSEFSTRLRTRIGSGYRIVNASLPGYKLYQLQPILEQYLRSLRPGVVLHGSMMQNDMAARTPAQGATDIEDWIDACRNAGARPVFLGCSPYEADQQAGLDMSASMRTQLQTHVS